MGVKGDVHVAGNTVLGASDSESWLEIHSVLQGRFPLSFAQSSQSRAGGSESQGGSVSQGGTVTLSVADPTGDSYLHLPDASGTILTSGSLPAVMDTLVVVGAASLQGTVQMLSHVEIGTKLTQTLLEVHSPLASSFPLSFAGASPNGHLLALSIGLSLSTSLCVSDPCINVYIYIFTYIYMYTYICIHIYMHVCTYVHMYKYLLTYIYRYMHYVYVY